MLGAAWDLHDYADVAQLIVAAFTAVGVIASFYLSTKALREVQRDREIRQAPFLVFETGGWRREVRFVQAGRSIPGLNPAYVATRFPNLPANAESVRLHANAAERRHYGTLNNLGSGPALDARVVWLADEVVIGQDSFEITDAKRQEPPYHEDLNDLPTSPSQIPPGVTAQLTRLPTFVEKDIDKKIRRVDGRLRILCKDIGGKQYTSEQVFHLFTGYTDSPPWVHVTFSDRL